MEKIGVIGLGKIAQKAYLPVMSELQDQFEWHLTTRNKDKGQFLKAKYNFSHLHQTLDQLIAEKPLAVFVHTPTKTHAAIIKKLLLSGINVYVDKPVSDDIGEVKELYKLAEEKNLLLTCGFNRRFAPYNQELKKIPNKRMITVEKTREDVEQNVDQAIFDLAIHSIDTAFYLMDEPIETTRSKLVLKDDKLAQMYFDAETKNSHIQVVTNMISGLNLEQSVVQGESQRSVVTNLSNLEEYTTGGVQQLSRPDWEQNLVTRGFKKIIMEFLRAVSEKLENPVSPKSSILSHETCYKIVHKN
ncbi:putative oxidoreductase (putative) [Companilactobacillus tucceti DSM 20183]|uniref:Putative oxidoreductase (Putative) n=1 Tax=Companilactobacillus tucceti DSM 20183 TaxID=1423811 RepID=A0A0R1IXX3_9LACO|nr:Gfo/Idh/MocA family oxidoreductase [Companilactobacillus tucceti]KRK64117.1 putative oxidoreductase (putative) [Companilactobacillus tucceti DSM 20183]